ncbi:calcium-binding protein [Sphingomonas hankyongi]|uniref:Calcium-binding protein n=1 Tax=Sphingomonas hankyongi TaxID=2908209 RepID=A0ABT0S120_9SPHN|nr:hypothetical protein [Sphingomonas hankyongi]MCL6729321.1 hypothetical protein [Sphingomonas hankyongi]
MPLCNQRFARNDQIYTDGGADIVRAGSGFDFVWLAAGLPGEISDLDGGADSDTLNLSGISAGVLVSDSSGAGSDIIITSAVTGLQIGVARGFEEIDGTSSADTIDLSHQIINFRVVGDGGGDTITGGSGDDDLSGGAGNDSITGGGGNDQMSGGDGDDILVAGPDNGKTTEFNQYQDRLDGGAGNDRLVAGYNTVLTGGTGADTFVFLTDPGDFTFVAQFDKGADKIDLTGFDANANVAGQQHFVWANGSNNGQIGVLNYAQVGFGSIGGQTLADYQVTADTDGDGVVDFSFYVRYVGATMSQSDFFI